MAIENYGRVYRLLKANVPVTIEMNVDTKFTGDHEHGFDTIAEIPGTDPKLKDEVVMVGGHLDSWASGTGATDNGAGTVVAMEVMRILNTLQVKPRRTIRVCAVDGRGARRVRLVRLREAALRLRAAVDRSRSAEAAGVGAQAGRSGRTEARARRRSPATSISTTAAARFAASICRSNAAIAPIFAQWIEPLKDLGVTTHHLAQHRRHRP